MRIPVWLRSRLYLFRCYLTLHHLSYLVYNAAVDYRDNPSVPTYCSLMDRITVLRLVCDYQERNMPDGHGASLRRNRRTKQDY